MNVLFMFILISVTLDVKFGAMSMIWFRHKGFARRLSRLLFLSHVQHETNKTFLPSLNFIAHLQHVTHETREMFSRTGKTFFTSHTQSTFVLLRAILANGCRKASQEEVFRLTENGKLWPRLPSKSKRNFPSIKNDFSLSVEVAVMQ